MNMLPTVEEQRSTSSLSHDDSPGAVNGGRATLSTHSTAGSTLRPPQQGQISRSSLSTIECGESKPTPMSMTKRWSTLELAGRCMFMLSVAFLIGGLLMTIFGFADINVIEKARLPLQIIGPVCLATTAVMWLLGAVFSRLWKMEWQSRQHALELRARVQLHAMAMDILNQRVLSPRIMQDPRLRRQLLMKLRQQSAMDNSSADNASRRSSHVFVASDLKRRRESAVSAIIRQELERRQSKDQTAILPPYELPGIQISRIETVDYDDGPGLPSSSGLGTASGGGAKRYIIFHSDLSSDFSQLSFTSEDFLPGSRSSRSRSSRASSNISSRLWDFSPRESEWDADISQGSRDSQLSKQDWGGGPSYGMQRELSLLSPTMPRKGSMVTFDTDGPTRRHSSPAPTTARRKSYTSEAVRSEFLPSAMRYRDNSGSIRHAEEYRTLNQYRKRSAEDQSIISVPIDENDGDEEDYDDDDQMRAQQKLPSTPEEVVPLIHEGEVGVAGTEDSVTEIMILAVRQSSPLTRINNDSEMESRVARILHEIDYSATESVDESKILTTMSSAEAAAPRVQASTQTLSDSELENAMLSGPFLIPRRHRFVSNLGNQAREKIGGFGQAIKGSLGFKKGPASVSGDGQKYIEHRELYRTRGYLADVQGIDKSTETESTQNSSDCVTDVKRSQPKHKDLDSPAERRTIKKCERKKFHWFTYIPSAWSSSTPGSVKSDIISYHSNESGSSVERKNGI